MVITWHVNAIVSFLISKEIKEIIPGIPVTNGIVNAYLEIADKDYPGISSVLVRSSATQIRKILAAIANFDNDRLFSLMRARLRPVYTEIIYDKLSAANINIGISCKMLESHIKEANRDFPEIDIAAYLLFLESPAILKQVIDSIITGDNNKLARYLMYIEDTYLSE